jgi:hypothetical protein
MRSRPRIPRRSAAEAVAVLAAAAVVGAAALLPWHASGEVERDAFELARAAEGLGLVSGGPRRVLFVCLAVLPMVAALGLAAAVARRPRLVGAMSCIAGGVGLASVAVAVWATDVSEPGPPVAAVAAVVAVACGASLVLRRSTRVRHH